MSVLRIDGLRFRSWGPFRLIVESGTCTAIGGASGAGKSLLLRAIADLDPHDGRIELGDLECNATPAPEWRRRVALLPAETAWWHDTVGEHFASFDDEMAGRLGFPATIARASVSRLSTGERQRLGLLRVLANRPDALLLDEPTASLDRESITRVEAIIDDYRREGGVPVIWVSHDHDQRARVAERRFVLNDGALLEERS